MANNWYNPYDSGIQWGEGIAGILTANKDKIMQILGIGGDGGGGGGGKKKQGAATPGGQGMGFQGGGAQGETMGGGSPAQAYSSAGASAGAKGASGMTPEMEQMLAEFLMSLGL